MFEQPLVLIVDDEQSILNMIAIELETQGFAVIRATSGEEALHLVNKTPPDIVVLDVRLRRMSGLQVLRRMRMHSDTPVILLSVKDTEGDVVKGLRAGADDYVVKPFNPEELSARVRAVLRRRTAPRQEHVLRAAKVEIDLDRRLVTKDGAKVSLSRTEWRVLQYLASNAGRVATSAQILEAVWGPDYLSETQYLRVWISRLRRKLEGDDAIPVIKTVMNVGYLLDAATERPA